MLSPLLRLAENLHAYLQTNHNKEGTLHYICEELKQAVNASVLIADDAGKTVTASLLTGEQLFPDATEVDGAATVLPIRAATESFGSLVLLGSGAELSEDEIAAATFCAAIAGLIMRYLQQEASMTAARETAAVKSAIGTLSYSELAAVIHIFRVLGGSEGLVVAKRIADESKVTRSVIVNALRKLESAGLVETRSLGMKGTYIKIVNSLLIDELNKLTN